MGGKDQQKKGIVSPEKGEAVSCKEIILGKGVFPGRGRYFVPHVRARHEENIVMPLPGTGAPLGILPVKKKSLVHKTNIPYESSADQHAATRNRSNLTNPVKLAFVQLICTSMAQTQPAFFPYSAGKPDPAGVVMVVDLGTGYAG